MEQYHSDITKLDVKPKIRESNFELLRIIAMLMVLVLHADFQAIGAPTRVDILTSPITSAVKVLFEMASIVAVNVFVLISGWFGIRPSVKGFAKFVFQCLFFSVGIYSVMLALGKVNLSVRSIADCFFLVPNGYYWFIQSYIALYLISPVLNAFIKTSDKKDMCYVLLAFYTFQTLYSFLGNSAGFIAYGYSAFSFMGLYLLAAFVKRHLDYSSCNKEFYIAGYIGISILMTIVWLGATLMDLPSIFNRISHYTNPLVIVSSVLLLLFFSKLKIYNGFINTVAASSFSVYLLHQNSHCVNYYIKSIKSVTPGQSYVELLCIIGIVMCWFIAAILIDQIRIILWDMYSTFASKMRRLYGNSERIR